MRIQHNIAALNSHRNLTNNNSAVGKNLEKLSSGYRINRAGDDAAGLAVSEKMRAQITGLTTAQKNAEDGISLVQTAEGALTEVHSMLNRMVELATQSANGTYSSGNREEMQKEINALRKEINRISDTANFNGKHLFKKDEVQADTPAETALTGAGPRLADQQQVKIENVTWGGSVITADTTVQGAEATKGKFTAGELKLVQDANLSSATSAKFTVSYKDTQGEDATKEITVNLSSETDAAGIADAVVAAIGGDNDLKALFTATATNGAIVIEAKTAGADQAYVTGLSSDAANDTLFTLAAGSGVAGTDEGEELKGFDLSGELKSGDTITIGGDVYTFKAESDGKDGKTFSSIDTLAEAAKANNATLIFADGGTTLIGATKAVEDSGDGEGTKVVYNKGDVFTYDLSKVTQNPQNGDEIQLLDRTFKFVAETEDPGSGVSALAAGGTINVAIGKDLEETLNNLATAIAGEVGTEFDVAVKDGVLTLTAKADGAAGSTVPGNLTGAFGDVTVKKTAAEDVVDPTSVTVQLHVGETSGEENGIQIEIKAMNTSTIGMTDKDGKLVAGKSINDMSIKDQNDAREAIDIINGAIEQISSIRSDLGAMQNRLEHTINNLGVQTENITAAESRIRDVDMAKEMMTYTKNNILVQASQAMLAQANQVPQGVLQLLQ